MTRLLREFDQFAAVDENSTCVLIFHFGSLPRWLPIWEFTAIRNPFITFFVVQDNRNSETVGNIRYINSSLSDFNSLPLMKRKKIRCRSPYKLCDFRPLYPKILESTLDGYKYWGWGDLDVFYGDLQRTIGPSIGRVDFISTGWQGQSGPLAFLRMSNEVVNLWNAIEDIESLLDCEKSFAIDETAFLSCLQKSVVCDLQFRECLYDLPAVWRDGRLSSIGSTVEYALFHFGGHVRHAQKSISNNTDRILGEIQKGGGFKISRKHRVSATGWWY